MINYEYREKLNSLNKVKLISDDELMLKETTILNIVKEFLVPLNTDKDEFLNKQYFWRIENDFKKNSISVDNDGNVVLINSDHKIFMINENNEWNSVIASLK